MLPTLYRRQYHEIFMEGSYRSSNNLFPKLLPKFLLQLKRGYTDTMSKLALHVIKT